LPHDALRSAKDLLRIVKEGIGIAFSAHDKTMTHHRFGRRWSSFAFADSRAKARERLQCERKSVAAAAAAAVVATTVVATTTAATETTATGRAGFHGASDVDGQVTTRHVFAMQALDGGFGFSWAGHFDKAKSFGAAGVALHHDFGGLNLTKGGEVLLEIVVTNRVGQVTDVEFVAHDGAFQKSAPQGAG
jgi:hypothetical protein